MRENPSKKILPFAKSAILFTLEFVAWSPSPPTLCWEQTKKKLLQHSIVPVVVHMWKKAYT